MSRYIISKKYYCSNISGYAEPNSFSITVFKNVALFCALRRLTELVLQMFHYFFSDTSFGVLHELLFFQIYLEHKVGWHGSW